MFSGRSFFSLLCNINFEDVSKFVHSFVSGYLVSVIFLCFCETCYSEHSSTRDAQRDFLGCVYFGME